MMVTLNHYVGEGYGQYLIPVALGSSTFAGELPGNETKNVRRTNDMLLELCIIN